MSGEGREDKEKALKTEEKIRINYKEGTGRKGEEQIKQKKRNESKREKTQKGRTIETRQESQKKM